MKGLWAVLVFAVMPAAHAEPWLCTDEWGNKAFNYDPTSARKKNCVHHPIPSGNVWRVRPREEASPQRTPGFPRVDEKTQRTRDVARREILERELAAEKQALGEAMKALEDQQRATASVGANARVEEKLRPYRDKVRVHLTNIANIQKELGRDG